MADSSHLIDHEFRDELRKQLDFVNDGHLAFHSDFMTGSLTSEILTALEPSSPLTTLRAPLVICAQPQESITPLPGGSLNGGRQVG
jgi:hypothetical protein